MSGKTDLHSLIENLSPKLHPKQFVFSLYPQGQVQNWTVLQPFGIFQEHEGTTLILEKQVADEHELIYDTIFSCITLMVYSSLNAVGLTAIVSHALAEANIPTNIVAAYYHDHIFVPESKASKAVEILKNLSKSPRALL